MGGVWQKIIQTGWGLDLMLISCAIVFQHYASRNGHTSVCELLLHSGASANSQTTSGGVTPLHRAAYCGHVDIVKLLLDKGANPELRDADGKLPLHKVIL